MWKSIIQPRQTLDSLALIVNLERAASLKYGVSGSEELPPTAIYT